MAIMISALYVGLVFDLYVSNWEFEVKTSISTLSIPSNEVGIKMIQCGVRGSLGPPCNAVGFVDQILLGENHMYKNPVYKRTKECSVNSPDYGPLPPNAPDWCLVPFDPEGLLQCSPRWVPRPPRRWAKPRRRDSVPIGALGARPA